MHPSSSSSSSTGPKNDTDVDQSTEVPHTTHLTHVFRALQFLHLFNSEIVDMRLSVDNTFSSLAAPSSSSQPPLPVLLKELDGNIRDVARRFFKLSKAASTVVEVVNVAQRHMQLYQQQQQQHEHEHVGRPGESSSVGDANTIWDMDRFESMRREIEESLTLRQRHHSLHLRGSRGESGDAGQHGMAAEVEVAEEQQEPHLLPQLPFTVSIGTAPFQSISSECRILLWHEVSGQPVERMRDLKKIVSTIPPKIGDVVKVHVVESSDKSALLRVQLLSDITDPSSTRRDHVLRARLWLENHVSTNGDELRVSRVLVTGYDEEDDVICSRHALFRAVSDSCKRALEFYRLHQRFASCSLQSMLNYIASYSSLFFRPCFMCRELIRKQPTMASSSSSGSSSAVVGTGFGMPPTLRTMQSMNACHEECALMPPGLTIQHPLFM